MSTRPAPRTYNRAATALVQCRSHIERARRDAALALEIFAELPRSARRRRPVRLTDLRDLLARLEETQRILSADRHPPTP